MLPCIEDANDLHIAEGFEGLTAATFEMGATQGTFYFGYTLLDCWLDVYYEDSLLWTTGDFIVTDAGVDFEIGLVFYGSSSSKSTKVRLEMHGQTSESTCAAAVTCPF